MPEGEGSVTFDDRVLGPITKLYSDLDDWVMLRADGIPLYNYGCVIDDHTMEITVVGRGPGARELHLPPADALPALGWEPPAFAHFPLILGSGPREAEQAPPSRGGRDAPPAQRRDARGPPQLRRPPGLEPRQRGGHPPGQDDRVVRLRPGGQHQRRVEPREAAVAQRPVPQAPAHRPGGRAARALPRRRGSPGPLPGPARAAGGGPPRAQPDAGGAGAAGPRLPALRRGLRRQGRGQAPRGRRVARSWPRCRPGCWRPSGRRRSWRRW